MPKKTQTKIRPSYKIAPGVTYEVVFADCIGDNVETMGECRFNERQIILKKNQSPNQMISTLIHELIHALDFHTATFPMNGKSRRKKKANVITEPQTCMLEFALMRFLKLNGLI